MKANSVRTFTAGRECNNVGHFYASKGWNEIREVSSSEGYWQDALLTYEFFFQTCGNKLFRRFAIEERLVMLL